MALAEMTPDGRLMPRGRIGDVVFYKRNGRFYSRRYVKPTDPQTPKQQLQRARFRRAHEAWKELSEQEKAEYRSRAEFLDMYSGHQLFMSENMTNEEEVE